MKQLLLPYKSKWIGVLLVLMGMIGSIGYIWFDFRLILPVFAVFSSFIETKTFAVFRTNVADELILLSFLAGFVILVFSKEKTERENSGEIRARALHKALIANSCLLLFSILFIFGNGFLAMILVNLYSIFIFYLIFFYLQQRKSR